MHTRSEHELGALGDLLDPDGPRIQVAQLSKAELAMLTKAADILEALGRNWEEDTLDSVGIDVALAMYTMRELVDAQGRVELV